MECRSFVGRGEPGKGCGRCNRDVRWFWLPEQPAEGEWAHMRPDPKWVSEVVIEKADAYAAQVRARCEAGWVADYVAGLATAERRMACPATAWLTDTLIRASMRQPHPTFLTSNPDYDGPKAW